MIKRRDFLAGLSLGAVAGAFVSPLSLMARAASNTTNSPYYPPSLTGLRGSHKGAFEVAHSIAWGGKDWGRPKDQTDDTYDLIVVGGGISGLSAAYLFQKQYEGKARILILENHDDLGGHAKRNEFEVDGKTLIGYGGSQTIDSPASYSPESMALMKELAIETGRFYDYYDQGFYAGMGLKSGLYFDSSKFGNNALTDDPFNGTLSADKRKAALNQFPISDTAKKSLEVLLQDSTDHFLDLGTEAKKAKLRSLTYVDYLQTILSMPSEATDILRDLQKGLWGVGFDAISALEATRLSMPGMQAYKQLIKLYGSGEPYIFHFPDGNAGIARLLVRKLVPEATTGTTMEDIVTAPLDYSALDKAGHMTRLRLNATAVDVRHSVDERFVDVCYVQEGQAARIRAKHVVMACYNNILPHICPDMPDGQREAIGYAKKVPLVYTNIALKNWKPFASAGYHHVHIPLSDMHHAFSLDFPVSMGDYAFSRSPEEPILVHGSFVPTVPDEGLNAREQHERGRHHLYSLLYDDFETSILNHMDGMLGKHGFDAERDIAAITVNRWPHGYAYEYNDYSDPVDWGPHKGPHIAGRAQMGRISIANSDASAYAYVNGAIDAAIRAVKEQVAL